MAPLAAELRRQLERAVVSARDVAETGAREALESLAVREGKPYEHMTEDQRALRRRLRAHARQLGDRREAGSGTQAIGRLAQECAYEHWHGMLFARFLAENELLIEPEHGVPVTLGECAELAQEEGVDQWALAARFAHRMLPQVFRPDHPAFEVRLAREHRLKLEALVEGLPAEVFAAADSLGWVYQFWQSRRKDEVNRSEVKIGADELPAVTQLFTEPYMVSFLLDNSLGAWWASRRLTDADLTGAESEAHLRRAAALPGVPLAYLRFVQSDAADAADGPARWRPAAGAFDAWPERLADLKVLDPCCGSGHFLVAALAMLAPMRMANEGLTPRAAVDAVLRDNLHGLELDQRCVALAAFALALAAWRWPGAGGYRPLPELNLACSGLAPNATKEEWSALAEQAAAADDTPLSAPLRGSLDALYDLFRQAPLLGSLIDPRSLQTELFQGDYESVKALFAAAAAQEGVEVEQTERAVAAQGMARAAELLAGRYHLVITNVPYLARGKQHEKLRDFCQRYFDAAKNDLATVFLERCLALCEKGGSASLVSPQNWLFLASYRNLRTKLLKTHTWKLLARLGTRSFRTPMWDFNIQLITISQGERTNDAKTSGEIPMMYSLDTSEFTTVVEKADALSRENLKRSKQVNQLANPDSRIVLEGESDHTLLREYADALVGLQTSDDSRFVTAFWEHDSVNKAIWEYLQSTPTGSATVDGLSWLVKWERGRGDLLSLPTAFPTKGLKAVGKSGIAVHRMGQLFAYRYGEERFHQNVAVVLPRSVNNLSAIWCFCSSPEYHEAVRRIDQKLNVTNATLVKVPFDLDHWTRIADEQYPNGLPLPHTDDPTQWIFHGHPCGSVIWDEAAKRTAHGPLRSDAGVLHVAVCRLLGYRWPTERDEAMELAAEQREWVGRCAALHDFADRDGIVCLPAVRGELTAEQRLLRLLSSAFGEAWSDATRSRLLASAGSRSLGDWLRDRFFEQHCKLFHHRPFVWHVWDGRRDGFHALVNYHKLAAGGGAGRRLLESLTYSYLGGWITRQKDGVERGAAGAEDRLAAAQRLQQRLAAITEGEPPFDIFVRWKPLAEQPVGWEPDVNDGVRLNIRPFMAADIPGGKTGAGILRAKPNIHWRKDRGKEPRTLSDDRELRPQADYPWFWPHGQFTGDRLNDLHLTIAEKHIARSGYTPVPER